MTTARPEAVVLIVHRRDGGSESSVASTNDTIETLRCACRDRTGLPPPSRLRVYLNTIEVPRERWMFTHGTPGGLVEFVEVADSEMRVEHAVPPVAPAAEPTLVDDSDHALLDLIFHGQRPTERRPAEAERERIVPANDASGGGQTVADALHLWTDPKDTFVWWHNHAAVLRADDWTVTRVIRTLKDRGWNIDRQSVCVSVYERVHSYLHQLDSTVDSYLTDVIVGQQRRFLVTSQEMRSVTVRGGDALDIMASPLKQRRKRQ